MGLDREARERDARRMTEGAASFLHLSYDHVPERAPDGTRVVLVGRDGELDAWLVLDSEGCFVDGLLWPSDSEMQTATVARRLADFL